MNWVVGGLIVGLVVLAVGFLWLAGQLVAARSALARQQADAAAVEQARTRALEAMLQGQESRFAELAAAKLAENQQSLVGLNAQTVGSLFNDLKVRLEKYEKEVAAARDTTKDSALAMSDNVKALQQFATQAQKFTAALLGGNKIQGNQGEQILARVLEQSGFQKGREYDLQVGTATDGGRPDVCVYDALNRHIVYIDAKMNIKDYIEAFNNPDDTVANRQAKKAALKKHATSIRNQIDGLALRRYAETIAPPREGYTNLPLVAMFCPFNAVLEAALAEDPTLMAYAFRKNIVLVTPTTLWGWLWLVSYGWKRVEAEKKYEEIQALGGEVVDKINDLLQDIANIGTALKHATAAYESLEKRAGDKGGKSVKRVARNLLAYGATPKKDVRLVTQTPDAAVGRPEDK